MDLFGFIIYSSVDGSIYPYGWLNIVFKYLCIQLQYEIVTSRYTYKLDKHHINKLCVWAFTNIIGLTVMVAKNLQNLISLGTYISFRVDLWASRSSYLLMKLPKAQRKLQLVSVTLFIIQCLSKRIFQPKRSDRK